MRRAPDDDRSVSLRDRAAAAAAARLPLGMQSVRVTPTARAALGLAAVGLLAALIAGWVLVRSRPQEIRAPMAAVSAGPSIPPRSAADPGPMATVAGSAPADSGPVDPRAAPTGLLVVDVIGPVRQPGVVRLPPGSRVVDALAAAGGLKPGASRGTLNMAAVLTDGQQVVVGGPAAPTTATSPSGTATVGAGPASAGAGVLDLNTATVEQLDQLPGVGPVLAQRILDWRTSNGRFTSVDQLAEVGGIGERKLADLRPRVRVS